MGINVTTAEYERESLCRGDLDRSGDYNKKSLSQKLRPIKAIQLEE